MSVKWPNDYNRPLSPEEQQIARRLDCAPEKARLATLLYGIAPELPAQRLDSDIRERRAEDVERLPGRSWFNVECGPNRGAD